MSDRWKQYQTVQIRIPKDLSSSQREVKLAGFDLEGTLIWGDRGQTFCNSIDDWIWSNPCVPSVLKKLREEGYTIAVFSTWKSIIPKDLEMVRRRIDNILCQGELDCWVFLATADDNFRKPYSGMFQLFLTCVGGISISEQSFYSGDAIGFKINESSWSPWYLWSNIDYKMALDVKLKFIAPDDVFGEIPRPQIDNKCSLIITCGQENSGWNLFYDSLKDHPKFQISDQRFIKVIWVMEVRDYQYDREMNGWKTPYGFDDQLILVVCGSFPQLEQRKTIASLLNCEEYTVFWYSRPSTKRLDRNVEEEYCKTFKHPEKTDEVWIRIN